MKINWKIRIKNKVFWLAIIPAILLVVQIVTGWFGVNFAADLVGQEASNLVNAIFGVLTILGVVNDHTTSGLNDSSQAMEYQKPRKDE